MSDEFPEVEVHNVDADGPDAYLGESAPHDTKAVVREQLAELDARIARLQAARPAGDGRDDVDRWLAEMTNLIEVRRALEAV